jgi:Endoribonuclease L-PSP
MLSGDAAGNVIGDGDFDIQTAQVFRNIEAALKSAGASWANVAQFTTYLVHSQDIPKFMAFRLREFPKMFPDGKYPPNTLLMVDRQGSLPGRSSDHRRRLIKTAAGPPFGLGSRTWSRPLSEAKRK